MGEVVVETYETTDKYLSGSRYAVMMGVQVID